MGACGCGELSVYEGYTVGPYVLAVEVYRGCSYCDTGLMVALHLFTPEEAETYDVEIKSEFKPDKYGHAEIAFPMVGQADLVKAAEGLEAKEEGGSLVPRYDSLADILRDYGLKLLQAGLRYRLKEIADEEAKRAAREAADKENRE
ncbi:MAG: hypothetical protein M3416_10725 [Acidobacteriota bacterium]|nr:hypothetical protein [Acidobacteriota bacterium]